MGRAGLAVLLVVVLTTPGVHGQLSITMVGNAGVVLFDGRTTLLVDLPYESGASGYMRYDVESLPDRGEAISVVTHHHRDHFAPELLIPHERWRVIGPASALETIPSDRVLSGDSIGVGAFAVVVLPTPHTNDHRSYRIRWQGLVLHFVGDTEDPSTLLSTPVPDVLFVTPWLSCAAEDADGFRSAGRRIAYHLDPRGRDRICGDVDVIPQGTSFQVGSLVNIGGTIGV